MKESYTQLAKKSTALKMIRAKTSEQNSTSLSTVATLPLPKKKNTAATPKTSAREIFPQDYLELKEIMPKFALDNKMSSRIG